MLCGAGAPPAGPPSTTLPSLPPLIAPLAALSCWRAGALPRQQGPLFTRICLCAYSAPPPLPPLPVLASSASFAGGRRSPLLRLAPQKTLPLPPFPPARARRGQRALWGRPPFPRLSRLISSLSPTTPDSLLGFHDSSARAQKRERNSCADAAIHTHRARPHFVISQLSRGGCGCAGGGREWAARRLRAPAHA